MSGVGPGVRMHWGVKIPMRDGARLNATLYLPEVLEGRTPAIFTLTPYVGQVYHDRAMYFAARGLPFLTVDSRGRGDSEGSFRPFIDEGKDGYDVIEWLAGQPYCDGRVSMWGGSYGGYVQWSAAALSPPHLASIAPVASPYLGVDFPIRSNVSPLYEMQWLTLITGRASQEKLFSDNENYWRPKFRQWFESGKPFRELDSHLGNPSSIFQEWVAHPTRDSYWDEYNPSAEQYAQLTIPVLTITGMYDGNQLGALAHYTEHIVNTSIGGRAGHYLVIGPWDHSGTRTPLKEFCGVQVGPASLIDLPRLHLDWYAWTMQNGPKPEFLRKNVAYYVSGADKWRYADSLEAVTTRTVPFYLNSFINPTDVLKAGWLGECPPTASVSDHYVYDPRDTSLGALESTVDSESRIDHRMVYGAVGKLLVYHSMPFESDAEISGFFKLSIWLSIDQPDTDVRAAVYEVALDGSVVQLSVDWMRTRHRRSLREEQLVPMNVPLRYDFDRFMFVSKQIAKGHRLRLVIGPINSIYSQKNYNAGGTVSDESMADARTVTVTLFHDESLPSALYVPFGQTET